MCWAMTIQYSLYIMCIFLWKHIVSCEFDIYFILYFLLFRILDLERTLETVLSVPGLELRSYFSSSTLYFFCIMITGESTQVYKSSVTNLDFIVNNTANTVAYWNQFSTSFVVSNFPFLGRFSKVLQFSWASLNLWIRGRQDVPRG